MEYYSWNLDLKNQIVAMLQQENFYYAFDDQEGMFLFPINLDDQGCLVRSVEMRLKLLQGMDYILYGYAPFFAGSSEQKKKVSDFFQLINYGLLDGNWEMDQADGEIRYKIFRFHDECPSTLSIRQSIVTCCQTMERYLPGIGGILFGDAEIEEVRRQCEDPNRVTGSRMAQQEQRDHILSDEDEKEIMELLGAKFDMMFGDTDADAGRAEQTAAAPDQVQTPESQNDPLEAKLQKLAAADDDPE